MKSKRIAFITAFVAGILLAGCNSSTSTEPKKAAPAPPKETTLGDVVAAINGLTARFLPLEGSVKKLSEAQVTIAADVENLKKGQNQKQSCPTACPNRSRASKKAPTAQRPHQAARATPKGEVKSVPAAHSVAAATTTSTSKGVGDTFESIKGGDRECVVYFNGARMYSQFVWGDSVTTKQKCDVFAATMYAKHMHGDSPSAQQIVAVQASPGIATATATASSSVSTAVVTQVAAASNFCVRAGQKYNCRSHEVVVIRPDGEFKCLPPEQAKVSGDQVCTGIQ